MTRVEIIDVAAIKRRAIVVTVVSAILGGPISILLGVISIISVDTKPRRAEKLTAVAWLILIVGWLLLATLFGVIVFFGEPTPQ